jgi:hypothetical protein
MAVVAMSSAERGTGQECDPADQARCAPPPDPLAPLPPAPGICVSV